MLRYLLPVLASLGLLSAQPSREEAIEIARATLTDALGEVPIRFLQVESAEWPDASLGCPLESQSYEPGLVLGFELRAVAGREIYDIHVGNGGAVICGERGKRPAPRNLPERVPQDAREPVTGEVPEDLLAKILDHLAEQQDTERETIDVVRGEAVTWNDGALGCPQPGQMYTQALVEGYHVELKLGERVYDYRASRRGRFLLCQDRAFDKRERGPRSVPALDRDILTSLPGLALRFSLLRHPGFQILDRRW